LSTLHLEQLGPDRAAVLGKLLAETVAWRRVHKEPVEILEQASNGSLADAVEIAVIRLVDRAIRSSSSVECVNARIRLVQVARKRLSEDFVCLLALYHNLKPSGRGSVRAGKSPAELAGAVWRDGDRVAGRGRPADRPRAGGYAPSRRQWPSTP